MFVPPLRRLLAWVSKPGSRRARGGLTFEALEDRRLLAVFTVTTTAELVGGSLDQAVNQANSTPGLDTIQFNITPAGPQTLLRTLALPTITDPVTIDGTTQPGFAGTPVVELNNVSGVLNAFVLGTGSTGSTIRGLVIQNCLDAAILVQSNLNIIAGNYIGTDLTGTVAQPNRGGVLLDGTNATSNTVGGFVPADRNVISGNNATGVIIRNGASNNFVTGNFIGTNAAGTAALGNQGSGVSVFLGTGNSVFANVISGNLNGGVAAGNTSQVSVSDNRIGTDVTGTFALGNGQDGVFFGNTSNSFVSGNVISGNAGNGISFNASNNNSIKSNLIGLAFNPMLAGPGGRPVNLFLLGETNAALVQPLPNASDGVRLFNSSSNLVGGFSAFMSSVFDGANVIAFNGGNGVLVQNGRGNQIRRNAIFSNGLLGIDLNVPGVTPNDPGDADPGSNDLQNFPVLQSAALNGTTLTVTGTLNSTPNTPFFLEFFASAAGDPSGFGEGARALGSVFVTTDAAGNAGFTAVLTGLDPMFPLDLFVGRAAAGDAITATATDLRTMSTSEFSGFVLVVGQLPPPVQVSKPSPVQSSQSSSKGDPAQAIALLEPDFTLPFDLAPDAPEPPPPLFPEPPEPPEPQVLPTLTVKQGGDNPVVGEISGRVFEDGDGDGVQGPGEPGLAGQTVFLDANDNGLLDDGEPFQLTNAKGEYLFPMLGIRRYKVRQFLSPAVAQTAPADDSGHDVTLSEQKNAASEVDFGLIQVQPDKDGVWLPDERGPSRGTGRAEDAVWLPTADAAFVEGSALAGGTETPPDWGAVGGPGEWSWLLPGAAAAAGVCGWCRRPRERRRGPHDRVAMSDCV